MLADQLENKLYNKVKAVTPLTSSTRFMTKVVHEAAKTAQIQKDQRRSSKPTESNEYLYNVKTRPETPKAGVNKAAHIVCFKCSKTGHYQRDCKAGKTCSYCKLAGHEAPECRKRIAAKVSYCTKCNRVGHDTADCRSKYCTHCRKYGHDVSTCRNKTSTSRANENVRAIDELANTDLEYNEDENNEENQ